MRSHHRPTLVIGFDEHGAGQRQRTQHRGACRWSARSGECAALLDKFGGHEMAAGLTVAGSALSRNFQARFLPGRRSLLSDEQLLPRLRLDAEVALAELDADFLSLPRDAAAFRHGQPAADVPGAPGRSGGGAARAQGKTSQVHAAAARRSGRSRYGLATPAIFFSGASTICRRPPWDVAFQVEANEYRGETQLQVQIQALRAAETLHCLRKRRCKSGEVRYYWPLPQISPYGKDFLDRT